MSNSASNRVASEAKRRKWIRGAGLIGFAGIIAIAIGVMLAGGPACNVAQPTEIFQGITYGCIQLSRTAEGDGLIHWVRVDLTAPGIEFMSRLWIQRLLPAIGNIAFTGRRCGQY